MKPLAPSHRTPNSKTRSTSEHKILTLDPIVKPYKIQVHKTLRQLPKPSCSALNRALLRRSRALIPKLVFGVPGFGIPIHVSGVWKLEVGLKGFRLQAVGIFGFRVSGIFRRSSALSLTKPDTLKFRCSFCYDSVNAGIEAEPGLSPAGEVPG